MDNRGSPTILLINFHSAQNAGDAALLESAITQLRSSFSNPYIIVSANYPEESYLKTLKVEVVPSFSSLIHKKKGALSQLIRFIFGLIYCLLISTRFSLFGNNRILKKWNKMLKAYCEADLVIGCPGNQFFSMGKFGFPFLLSSMSVLLAHAFHKPFYAMPQSIGPLNRFWERWLIKWLYGKGRLIYVRDPISLNLAKDLGLPVHKIQYAPDLAFDYGTLNLESNEPPQALYPMDMTYGAIGVTVIRRMVHTLREDVMVRYYNALANALSRIIHQYNVKIYFFPQVTGPTAKEDDRIAAQLVAEQMKDTKQNIFLIQETLTPQRLKSLYSRMDIFIASRLHSGIFAISLNIPTLFIGYLTKTRGVTESIGMSEWVVDLETLDAEYLYKKIEELWLRRKEIKELLSGRIPVIAHQVRQVGQQIANDFYSEQHGKPQ